MHSTAASDALIKLLLAHRSGSAFSNTPTPTAAGLAAILPTTSALPPGPKMEFEGVLIAEPMPLTFSAPAEASERLASWGRQENVSRRFVADGELLPGASSSVEISLHQFAFDTGASSALPYFAEARAQSRGLSLVPIGSTPPGEATVIGQGAASIEATIYLRLGSVLLRVTAVVPDGPAEYVAPQVANAVIAKRAQPTAV